MKGCVCNGYYCRYFLTLINEKTLVPCEDTQYMLKQDIENIDSFVLGGGYEHDKGAKWCYDCYRRYCIKCQRCGYICETCFKHSYENGCIFTTTRLEDAQFYEPRLSTDSCVNCDTLPPK